MTGLDSRPKKDRAIIGIIIFFLVVAWTVEFYWLFYHRGLPRYDCLGRLWAVYGESDRGYCNPVSPFSLALEGFHVFATTWLHVWLLYAILRRAYYRHALQLSVSSYIVYSVVLYFLVAHLSGYSGMSRHDWRRFTIFFGANLPWLLGSGYMVYDSITAINARLRQEAESERCR